MHRCLESCFIRPRQPISACMASLAGAHDIEPTTISRTALQGPAADAVSRAGLGGQPAYSCPTAAGDISRRSAGSEPASSSQAAHRGAPQNDLQLVCDLHCMFRKPHYAVANLALAGSGLWPRMFTYSDIFLKANLLGAKFSYTNFTIW